MKVKALLLRHEFRLKSLSLVCGSIYSIHMCTEIIPGRLKDTFISCMKTLLSFKCLSIISTVLFGLV